MGKIRNLRKNCMTKPIVISRRQQEIIIGKLLGDGHLETVNGKTYRLKIEHSYKQREYVDWLHQEFKNLTTALPKIKLQKVKGKEYKKYWFNTGYTPSFINYGQQFYQQKRKIVPVNIHELLTPLALAVWFMDDGSIKSKECKGKILNTQGFQEKEVKILSEAILLKYRIQTRLRFQKEGFQIYIPASQAELLIKIMKPFIHPSLQYKLG